MANSISLWNALCYIPCHTTLFPQHRLWVSLIVRASVFVPHCWFSSFRTPRIRRGLLLLLSGPLPITDLVLPSSLGGDFHYTTIITKSFHIVLEMFIFSWIFKHFVCEKAPAGKNRLHILKIFHIISEILIFPWFFEYFLRKWACGKEYDIFMIF